MYNLESLLDDYIVFWKELIHDILICIVVT